MITFDLNLRISVFKDRGTLLRLIDIVSLKIKVKRK